MEEWKKYLGRALGEAIFESERMGNVLEQLRSQLDSERTIEPDVLFYVLFNIWALRNRGSVEKDFEPVFGPMMEKVLEMYLKGNEFAGIWNENDHDYGDEEGNLQMIDEDPDVWEIAEENESGGITARYRRSNAGFEDGANNESDQNAEINMVANEEENDGSTNTSFNASNGISHFRHGTSLIELEESQSPAATPINDNLENLPATSHPSLRDSDLGPRILYPIILWTHIEVLVRDGTIWRARERVYYEAEPVN
jgi:hypothetical protein